MRKTGSITPWLLLGCGLDYAAVTLAVAMLATPAAPQDTLGAALQQRTGVANLADVIPGASVWPQLMDMQGKLAGTFPTPLAGVMLLGLGSVLALSRVGSIRARRAKDAEIDHDEERREAVRRRNRA